MVHRFTTAWSHPLLVLAFVCGNVACLAGDNQRPYQGSFPIPDSKKGLQVELVDDALALGIHHATINVNLAQLIAPGVDESDAKFLQYEVGGKSYGFHKHYVRYLDDRLRRMSERGILVYFILLARESHEPEVNRILLHPAYIDNSPNRIGAFNTVTAEGREWLSATIQFLAERWSNPSREHGQVAGYIVGNEVNSHWFWSNRGKVGLQEFTDDYLTAVRLVHRAVRRRASWPRVYISLDHHWNIRYVAGDEDQSFAGRAFIDLFAKRARETEGGDFDWHVAYHPYPEDLFEPKFWHDRTAIDSPDTPRITFKNLHVLPEYLRQPDLLHEGKPRRIILSEQGFHSTDGKRGEDIQAAAFCYAYEKIDRLEGIDAFILHRHIDHPREGGLNLGLRRRTGEAENPYPPKRIYECFRAAGTPEWKEVSDFALPIVGLKQWDDLTTRSTSDVR